MKRDGGMICTSLKVTKDRDRSGSKDETRPPACRYPAKLLQHSPSAK